MGNPLNMGQSQQQPDLNQLYQQFIQGPWRYLTGLNIPKNITTPEEMVKYCLQNNKVPPILQQRINAMMGRK